MLFRIVRLSDSVIVKSGTWGECGPVFATLPEGTHRLEPVSAENTLPSYLRDVVNVTTDDSDDDDTNNVPTVHVDADIANAFGMADLPNVHVNAAVNPLFAIAFGAAPAAPTPAPRVELVTRGARTKEQAAEQIATQERIVADVCGVAPPPPWFAPGTEMLAVGKDTYRTLAREHADLPPAREAASDMIHRIRDERRVSVVAPLSSFRVHVDAGRLMFSRPDHAPFGVEGRFLRDIGRMNADVFRGGADMLLGLSPHVAADVLNDLLPNIDKVMQLRVRTTNGLPAAFAVVGKGYSPADADVWLTHALPHLDATMRGAVSYNPVTTDVEAKFSWNAPHDLDAKVGDVFRAGWRGQSRDNGTGSFKGGGWALRVRCINCTVIEMNGEDIRRVHKGSMANLAAQVAESVTNAREGFAPFADAWGILRETSLVGAELFGVEVTDLRDVLPEIAGRIGVTGASAERIGEELVKAYDAEPGDTAADFLNAVTRAAHEAEWSDLLRRCMEERAGQLVYELLPGQELRA